MTASEDAGSYEQLIRSSTWLPAMPFEHVSRGVPHELFLRRLVGERSHSEDPRLQSMPPLTLVVLSGAETGGLSRTLESLLLQSGLRFRIVLAARDPQAYDEIQDVVQARLASAPYLSRLFHDRIACAVTAGVDAWAGILGTEGYVTCLRAGDVLHPSAVASLDLELWNATPPADLYVWNETVVDYGPRPSVQRFIRKPQLEWFTLLHFNYISHCFALRTALVPGHADLRAELEGDGFHGLLLTALRGRGARAVTIPQYLFLRDAAHVGASVDHERLEGLRARLDPQGFAIEPREGPARYRLVPSVRSRRVSVVIPFRDQPQPTCDAIRSLTLQQSRAELEIVLVDNRSRPEAAEQVRLYAESLTTDRVVVRMLEYDKPFNHSAECNLGAAAATGDALVFLNNDAELLTPGALEQMSSWSLVEGVGTVGLRMVGRDGRSLVSAGVSARLALGPDFSSLVTESRAAEFADYNRETLGNTFACVAVARRTMERVGVLDEVNFPVGYNDVDYSLRCRRAGLVNLYLGTECARHEPGLSRGRSDEVSQKLLLRRRYPEVLPDSLFQLQCEERPAVVDVPGHPGPKPRGRLANRFFSWLGRRLRPPL